MSVFNRKYGVALASGTFIEIPLIKAGSTNYAVGADWTPASGDIKIRLDGGSWNNLTSLPTASAAGNAAVWVFTLTAAELQAKQVEVMISDATTKAIEDDYYIIETFGNASAMYPNDWSVQSLPTVTAGSSNGLPTIGTGANQLNPISGNVVLAPVLHDGATVPTVTTVSIVTNFPTISGIVNAVWNQVKSLHTTSGTFGSYLDQQISSLDTQFNEIPTLSGIVNGVWEESQSSHSTAGTFGKYLDYQSSTLNTKLNAVPTISGIWTNTITESYAADGAACTPAQLMYMLWSAVAECNVASTTITCKKLDGSTTSMTFTLDDATNPTSRTRAS